MKIIYEAEDGTQFDSDMACMAHEASMAFKMYDDEGEVTDIDTAYLLELSGDGAAKHFLQQFKAENTKLVNGIEEGDTGLFVWDASKNEYAYLCEYAIGALRYYLNHVEKGE